MLKFAIFSTKMRKNSKNAQKMPKMRENRRKCAFWAKIKIFAQFLRFFLHIYDGFLRNFRLKMRIFFSGETGEGELSKIVGGGG